MYVDIAWGQVGNMRNKPPQDEWIADVIGSVIFFVVVLSMMIEWDIVFGWFKG